VVKDYKPLPAGVIDLIKGTFLYRLMDIVGIRLDVSLITALVERWRQETHTFHLPTGEATVTLKDVSVLFGLPIEGTPITLQNQSIDESRILCEQTFGISPAREQCKYGGWVSGTWLDSVVKNMNVDHLSAEEVRRFAMLWMLQMVGGLLFPDKSLWGSRVTYLAYLQDINSVNTWSWGSSVLVMLYRQLCKGSRTTTLGIAGLLLLLQLWA
jgi:hypothetical protein